MDFMTYAYYQANGVKYYWGFGTALSCITMVLGLLSIVNEYCTQSHLSTENYDSAARGLRTTRRWKKSTMWIRSSTASLTSSFHFATFSLLKPNSKTLSWDHLTKDERIWRRRAKRIHRRSAPHTNESEAEETGIQEPLPPVQPLAALDRTFSNNTTLADPDEQERWYAKALGEMEREDLQAPERAISQHALSRSQEGARDSPLSRSSTLWF